MNSALRAAIEKIPTREERLGGQTFKYVKLSEVLDLLDTDQPGVLTSKERCFHSELRRDRHDETDAYLDVWYCPEPQCDFEVNLCKHNNQRQGEHGLPYCADCGAQVPESLRPAPETLPQQLSKLTEAQREQATENLLTIIDVSSALEKKTPKELVDLVLGELAAMDVSSVRELLIEELCTRVHPNWCNEDPTSEKAECVPSVLPPAFQSLVDLEPNWDSYGAPRINLACIQKAYEIWKQLAGTWLPVPHSDGTVGLEQHQGGFDIEIDVDLVPPSQNGSE